MIKLKNGYIVHLFLLVPLCYYLWPLTLRTPPIVPRWYIIMLHVPLTSVVVDFPLIVPDSILSYYVCFSLLSLWNASIVPRWHKILLHAPLTSVIADSTPDCSPILSYLTIGTSYLCHCGLHPWLFPDIILSYYRYLLPLSLRTPLLIVPRYYLILLYVPLTLWSFLPSFLDGSSMVILLLANSCIKWTILLFFLQFLRGTLSQKVRKQNVIDKLKSRKTTTKQIYTYIQ